MRASDGHRRAYRKMRDERPEVYARKRQRHRAAYQQLVRDPERYALYLAWKREWYRRRQEILRQLQIDPSPIERAVMSMMGEQR